MQLCLGGVVLASVVVLAQAGSVQLSGLTVPSSAAADRASVVKIFNESYNLYRCAKEIFCVFSLIPKPEVGGCRREVAFGHDEMGPLSLQAFDSRNGWGATIVDAMDTMVCASHYIPVWFLSSITILVHHGTYSMTTNSCFLSRRV